MRKIIAQGASTKYTDKDGNHAIKTFVFLTQLLGNTALYNAAGGNHTEAMRFLIENGAEVNNVNNEGNTPLHHACEKGHREAIFSLLFHGADPLLKNNKDEKPGENNPEIELFINSIMSEQKAFKSLREEKREKLKQIFADIDKDSRHTIDLNRSKEFNIFTENQISDGDALEDAQDFIASVAICNKTTVIHSHQKIFA